MNLRAQVLKVLADEGKAYGLEVMARIEHWTGTNPGPRVYPILRSLEDDGLATVTFSAPLPDRGNRPRVYYTLTETGITAAKDAT